VYKNKLIIKLSEKSIFDILKIWGAEITHRGAGRMRFGPAH